MMYAFNVFCKISISSFFSFFFHEFKFFFLKQIYYAYALSHVISPRMFYFSKAVFGDSPKLAYISDLFYEFVDIISTFFDSLFMFLFNFFIYLCFFFSIVLLFLIFITVVLYGLEAAFYCFTLFYTKKELLYFFWFVIKYV